MAGRGRRGVVPPIIELLDLIEEHRGAFEYDWRSRFHLSARFPEVMGWGEAWRLTQVLLRDPSSWVAAALAGWQRPATHEELATGNLYDLTQRIAAKGKLPSPHPRPWDEPRGKRIGSRPMSKERLRAVLDHHRAQPAVEQEATVIRGG